eukprot:3788-Heterococcus_DN1.PRE.4
MSTAYQAACSCAHVCCYKCLIGLIAWKGADSRAQAVHQPSSYNCRDRANARKHGFYSLGMQLQRAVSRTCRSHFSGP